MTAIENPDITRRVFLKKTADSGLGLTLSIMLPVSLTACAAQETVTPATAAPVTEFAPNAFVRVNSDNTITVVIKHLEMGQGTFTGLATLVAEEMDADWSQIRSESAPADASRYNNLAWGTFQGTGGSSAIANAYTQMREAGATARYLLVAAAAQQWQVPADSLTVQKGTVVHRASNRSASFGELAAAAASQSVPTTIKLKDPKDFTLIGKMDLPRKDTGKTNGTAIFTQDIKLPDMLVAVVAHPPRWGAQLVSFDASKTKTVAGVVDVVRLPNAVAVLSKDYWTSKKGRDALVVEWNEAQAFKKSSAEIMADYKALAEMPGVTVVERGDVEAAFKQAYKVLQADYEFPFLAHATMEPMNCVIQRHESGVEVWNGAQLQTGDQMAIAQVFGIKPEQVKINTLFAGGSFGRRANPLSDYVVEAATIAKAYGKNVPIKLVWSREDDMNAGYFRPMYFHRLKAAINKQGKIIAWQQRIVGQSIIAGTAFAGMMKNGIDPTSVEGVSNLPYHIENFSLDLHTTKLKVPVQWWRSVGSTHTAYSTETFMDALARAAGKDPLTFRLAHLQDHPRHAQTLTLAAEKAGWGTPLPKGKYRGLAVHESFNTYVAQVAEIAMSADGKMKVEKVTCAVDCGVAVNPDVIKAQMEGGIGYGLSPALNSAITLEQGKVVENNFDRYGVVRIGQMPEIDVHIVASGEPPTGVGEPGTPVIAPAVANAVSMGSRKIYGGLPLVV